ncbi:MAG: hypothetical protein RL077_5521 [Verrucomicrobiota bacterium]|jgi:hypothetical protein
MRPAYPWLFRLQDLSGAAPASHHVNPSDRPRGKLNITYRPQSEILGPNRLVSPAPTWPRRRLLKLDPPRRAQ